MQSNLVRKQYLVSPKHVKKLEKIASNKGTSAAEVVRQAIDAYDPLGTTEMEAPELMELVATKLKEAITATKKTNRKVAKALHSLNAARI